MQKIIFILDFINNDVSDELKRHFIINTSIQSYETHSSQIFHIPKARTSKFGINTLTYGNTKTWNQLYFEFVFNKLSQWNEVTTVIALVFALCFICCNGFVLHIPEVFNNTNIYNI